TACTLTDVDFSECVLSECTLSGLALQNINLKLAILNKCQMSGCRFENIHAFATQFVECDLSHAAFSGTCEQSTFKDCMLDHSLLAFSVNKNNTIATCAMDGAVIRQDLEQLTLFRLDLRHCKFDSKNMPQTVFFESQAAGLALKHRNLTGSQFIDADFSGAL